MFEVQMLVPVSDNSGRFFDEDSHAMFENRASRLFGGITRLPAAAAGVWVDAGRVYRDRTLVYVVSLRSIADGAKVARLAAFAKRHYRQEAIYVRYLGVSEIL